MNPQPLVSIIIPTFNRAHLIGETLDSVLAQTYPNWECIIVDDGSSDNTDEVVGSYVKKDPRFQYHHRPADRPKGANACRNYGFEISKGEYVQWLDSDDLLVATCIDKRLTYFQAFKIKDFLVFQTILYHYRNTVSHFVYNFLNKEMDDLSRFIIYDYPWNTNSAIFKRVFVINNKIYWEESLSVHQDLGFNIQLLNTNPNYCKIIDLPDVLVRMNNKDKLSGNTPNKSKTFGKYIYLTFIFNILRKSNKIEFCKKELYSLALFYMDLYFREREIKYYLKVPQLFLKNGLYLYAPVLLLDQFYILLRRKFYNKTFRKLIDFYTFFNFEERIQFLPPRGSTLGKVSVDEHLKNTVAL